ncbi:MAG: RHS repeat-associated core domain-containing protein [Actinobacteria bacterium]|nr:RHS repeat-associated core domain-containing protein [Actinomycetota bacterium]
MGNIISRKDTAGTNFFYHYSALSNISGNVTALTDSAQTTVATYAYEAFGNMVVSTGTAANNYKFSTKNLDDESGLYYFGARYYDSETGRFITKDPDGGDVKNPLTLNPYVYASDNPVNLVDPTGEYGLELAGTGLAVTQFDSPILGPADIIGGGVIAVGLGIATYEGLSWAGAKLKNWYFAKKGGADPKDVIDGQLRTAAEHIGKLKSYPPNDPNRNKWRKEAKNAIRQAREKLKRLKGKTRIKYQGRIESLQGQLNKF